MTDKSRKLRSLMSQCQGVILDFDGLIADSEPFHYRAYNTVFERYGHSIDPDEYWVEFTSKGKGIQGEVERYNLKLDVKPEDMRQQKFEIYSRFCRNGDIKLFPEARQFIESLVGRYRLAIASGSWAHDIRAILKHEGADSLISTILGKDPSRREKPHPDIFLDAARELGLEPGQCVVLEDALKGLQAAREAGMPCIIVKNRLNRNIDFSGSSLVLESLSEFSTLMQHSG
ncbi:MAG: HAD-IA family hydrolase [Nitrospinaceae bacterium]|nr:HAD family phosphatase [Nitrospinaceae bacterium]NIR53860.1 HAD family phosphatase [Nitrospinaceae bacterium]NIS84274.1 HAD family phosphatase [Nitrospinaceae bacterium]NIT81081.1 HAD family phosphatase [Nitrospinaceae bacterium]NIU43363.1 HAD family phosphatase [Nitrospinaceae bacterium]